VCVCVCERACVRACVCVYVFKLTRLISQYINIGIYNIEYRKRVKTYLSNSCSVSIIIQVNYNIRAKHD